MMRSFKDSFESTISTLESCLDVGFDNLEFIGQAIVDSINNGGKLMICGNGGSAADAQHLVAELLIRLKPLNNRRALPALSLAQDVSTITACGNDFAFENLYSRVLEGLGNPSDALLVISTSGNSENIYRVLSTAKKLKIKSFGFLGSSGGRCLHLCDKAFVVPSSNTANIQEAHITAGHALMSFIEDSVIYGK